MKKIILFSFLFMPYILIGQCVCGVGWTVATGAANLPSNNGGICVDSEWTGFITDHLGGASICVTENGKWIPAAPALSVSGFSGNFDLGINTGGLVEIGLGNPVINLAGKVKNYGGSLICDTSSPVTFGDTLWNNLGGLLTFNSGSLLTQNLLNSGIINLSCKSIEILGASNLGTININQDSISIIHNRQYADGTTYLVSPIQIGVLNNFAQVNLLGDRIVEIVAGCLINNDGENAVMDFDVLGEAGIRLAGCTLNNLNGGRVLAGYLESALGTITNASSARIDVTRDLFSHGVFNNNGYIGVGADLQIGVPGATNIPGVNNNQIIVEGDILIKGNMINDGIIAGSGEFVEGYIEQVETWVKNPLDLLGALIKKVVDVLRGEDFLSGDGVIWLSNLPKDSFQLTSIIETGALTNNTLKTGPTVGVNGGVFPVKIHSLKGTQIEKRVQLSWEVSDYQDFHSFVLERSRDAKSFEGIAMVNNANTFIYNENDMSPIEGVNYYRLKLRDMDGGFVFSKIISVNYEKGGSYMVFENPVKNNRIEVKTNMNNPMVRISDITGRDISYNINLTSEGYQISPINSPSGVLLVTFINEKERLTKKAIMR